MSDEERLPLTSAPAAPGSRGAKWKHEIAELLESAEFHWSASGYSRETNQGKLTFPPPSGQAAIIGLTSADALFVIAEVSWDLFMEDKCSPEAREEPPIIHMCALLSLIVTCERLHLSPTSFNSSDQTRRAHAGCFTLEIPLAIFAFGLRYYKRLLHAFDALVVIATFVLEVGLHVSCSALRPVPLPALH